MGRDLLTVAETSALLEVSSRTISKHIQEGLLAPIYVNKRPMLLRVDVENLDEARRLDISPRKAKLLATQALAATRALERRIAFLEELLGAKKQVPPTDAESVSTIFIEANDDLDEIPISLSRVMYWAGFFMTVGEEFFDVVYATTEDDDAWQIFLELGQAISEELLKLELNPDMRAAWNYLEVGRRNLRTTLFQHLRARLGIRAALKTLGEPEDVHDEILNFAIVEATTHLNH